METVSNSCFLHHKIIVIFGGAVLHGNLTLNINNCFFHALPFIPFAHVKMESFIA
jgi:hypothetical protein